MIIKCICKHEDQDRLHGTGNRVANLTKDLKGRCTVCKSLVSISTTSIPTTTKPKGKK